MATTTTDAHKGTTTRRTYSTRLSLSANEKRLFREAATARGLKLAELFRFAAHHVLREDRRG